MEALISAPFDPGSFWFGFGMGLTLCAAAGACVATILGFKRES